MDDENGEIKNLKPKTLLISLYNHYSLSLRCIYGMLKEHGYPVQIVFLKDPVFNDIIEPTKEEFDLLVDILLKFNPDLVGISVNSSFVDIASKISKLVNKNKKKTVVWGGSHPTIFPDECIKHADTICVGEGEMAFLDLVQKMENQEDITSIESLWFNQNGKIIKNETRVPIQDLDTIPIIDYDKKNKYSIENNKLEYIDPYTLVSKVYVMAGRGCPFKCSFCINSYLIKIQKGELRRKRSVDHLIKELEVIKTKFPKVTEIFFVDEVFIMDEEWVNEFCEKYKKIGIPFQCEFYPTTVRDHLIKKYKEVGLYNVNMGIQTGSNRVRFEIFKRPTSDNVILNAANIFKKYKITPTYDLIVDNPYETEQDLQDSIKFLLKLPRPYNLNIFSLVSFPKVDLTEKMLSDNLIPQPDPKKALSQWRMTFEGERSKESTYFNCLTSLLSKSFIPKILVNQLSKSSYLKKNPRLLTYFTKSMGLTKLGLAGIKQTLQGRMTFAKIKYQLSRKGIYN